MTAVEIYKGPVFLLAFAHFISHTFVILGTRGSNKNGLARIRIGMDTLIIEA